MKIIKNTIKTLRFQRLDNEGEPITSTPEELRVVIKKDDHATASIVKTLSNGDIKWTESDLSWFFTIETPETGHLELGAYGLRVFETIGGVEYQVYETEMRVVELYSDPGDDKKYPSPSADLNFYQAAIRADDESDARGIFCGTVTNGDIFPTTRPDGTPLQNEDYARPDSNATFPFDVEGVTFTSIRDKAYYINGTWMLDAGALQDTSETPLKNKTIESLSGESTNQKAVNVENKNAITNTQSDITDLGNNKVSKTNSAFQVYATDGGGAQTTFTYNASSSSGTIVKRDGDGRFEAVSPVSDSQVANKKYVDDEVGQKVKDVKLDGSSIVDENKEALLTKTNIINSIKDESKTFTNTTLDIDSNNLSNVEVDNFKNSAIAKTISSSPTDDKLPTEKAVKNYSDGSAKSLIKDSINLKLKDANGTVLSTVTGEDLQNCTKEVTATLKNKKLDFDDNNRLDNFEDNTTIIKDTSSKLSLNKDNDTIQYDSDDGVIARNFKEVSTFVGESGKSYILYYLNTNISGYNRGLYKYDSGNFVAISTSNQLGGFVGYIDETIATLPATRPDGSTLQNGDCLLPRTTATFPFTVGGLTSTNINDLFVYSENTHTWVIRDGQDSVINVTTLPTSGIKTNVIYRLNESGDISYYTYYDGQWRKIIDSETLKEYLRGFKFVGYVSTSEPTGQLKKDDLWYNSVSGSMPTVFPINVKRYNGSSWSTTTEEYTPTAMDLWANKNDNHGYYWFGNEWNTIDGGFIRTTLLEYGVDDYATTLNKLQNSEGVIFIKEGPDYQVCAYWVRVTSTETLKMYTPGGIVTFLYKIDQETNTWSRTTLNNEMQSNRVTVVNSDSDHYSYPTAKAVYDSVDTRIAQYGNDAMPTPAASNLGDIVEYVGATTANYTSGYFYKCVSDTTTTPTSYSWVQTNVQQPEYTTGALTGMTRASMWAKRSEFASTKGHMAYGPVQFTGGAESPVGDTPDYANYTVDLYVMDNSENGWGCMVATNEYGRWICNVGIGGAGHSGEVSDWNKFTTTTDLAVKQDKITISTSAPSGGSDGDIWLQVA